MLYMHFCHKEHPEYATLFEQLGFFVKDASAAGGYALNAIASSTAQSCACNGAGLAALPENVISVYDNIMAPCVKLYEG